jgi:hypothetical protein
MLRLMPFCIFYSAILFSRLNQMRIVLPSTPTQFNFPFRVIGRAGRYDTISDCEFLSNSRIVCVDRQTARLYLIEFDLSGNTHRIVNSVTAICDGQPQNFELIALRKNETSTTVYSVSYQNTLFTCELEGDTFRNLRTQVVRPEDSYHGVIVSGPETVIVTNMRQPSITEFNTRTGAQTTVACDGGQRIKDATLIDADHIITISSDNGPINGNRRSDGSVTPHNRPYDSHVLVYDRRTATRLSRLVLPATQVDGCIYHAPYCFVTCTDLSGTGSILRCKVESDYSLTEQVHIPCASFPHGLAIHGDLFAYTSYGESALYILPLSYLDPRP